ncbi:MAG: hypothetical protein KIT60_07755 [Burkholderiaceae bacterium]|nr:hypothetical protein [Burkholderiaceae bacterium]
MFARSLLGLAAVGVVSLWYLRARAPSGMRIDIRWPRRGSAVDAPQESPNAAERLTHSHAMGVAGGIEMPVAPPTHAAPADAEPPGDAAWPASREFLRGA